MQKLMILNKKDCLGSNHILQNRQLIFSPKTPYDLVAKRGDTKPFANSLLVPLIIQYRKPLVKDLMKWGNFGKALEIRKL